MRNMFDASTRQFIELFSCSLTRRYSGMAYFLSKTVEGVDATWPVLKANETHRLWNEAAATHNHSSLKLLTNYGFDGCCAKTRVAAISAAEPT